MLILLTRMDSIDNELASYQINALVNSLTSLLNEKHKTNDHYDLISGFLSIMSTQNNERVGLTQSYPFNEITRF